MRVVQEYKKKANGMAGAFVKGTQVFKKGGKVVWSKNDGRIHKKVMEG